MAYHKVCPICSNEFSTSLKRKQCCSRECGNIFRMNTPQDFWNRVDIKGPDDCWVWKGSRNKGGYGQFCYNGIMVLAHRLALIFTSGPIPDGLGALHSCNNRPCCNPKHLRPGTNKENAADKILSGHMPSYVGTKNINAKLDETQVIEIRDLFSTGNYYHTDLAKMFNVSDSTIHTIVKRHNWKHI